MGNCLNSCFRKCGRRKYLRTKYNIERDASIEFENLMEEETHQPDETNNVLSSYERQLLSKRAYGAFIDLQKQTDMAIDNQLVQQEEELRREEEAAYEARRQQAEMSTIERPPVEGADDSAFLDEDFESFLESVRMRSSAACNRPLPPQVQIDQQSISSLNSKDRADDASSLDLEWEHELGMQPPPKEARERLRRFPLKDDTLAELNVRPMLTADMEWEADFGGLQEDEKQQLLSSRISDIADR